MTNPTDNTQWFIKPEAKDDFKTFDRVAVTTTQDIKPAISVVGSGSLKALNNETR